MQAEAGRRQRAGQCGARQRDAAARAVADRSRARCRSRTSTSAPADSANKQGLVKSAQANLDRLRVLEKYKRIVAPFDGLVTARTTDVGALINAGGGGRRCSWCRTRQQAARLRQRAAELRAEHQDRHQGADLGARISGPELLRRPSRPPRSRSTSPPARRACSSSSTMRAAS